MLTTLLVKLQVVSSNTCSVLLANDMQVLLSIIYIYIYIYIVLPSGDWYVHNVTITETRIQSVLMVLFLLFVINDCCLAFTKSALIVFES